MQIGDRDKKLTPKFLQLPLADAAVPVILQFLQFLQFCKNILPGSGVQRLFQVWHEVWQRIPKAELADIPIITLGN